MRRYQDFIERGDPERAAVIAVKRASFSLGRTWPRVCSAQYMLVPGPSNPSVAGGLGPAVWTT